MIALAAAWLSSCVDSPRSESTLAQRTDPLYVSGLFEAPGATLDLEAWDHRGARWVRFATTTTRPDDPLIDAEGRPYFRYRENARLPQGAEFWFPHVRSAQIEARVRVVHGERVLSVFGGKAEHCLRRAQAAGKREREALAECAADVGYARVFVAACGGEGEACCAAPAATRSPRAAGACDATYTCEAGVCVAPRYPPPIVKDYQVDLAIPLGYALENAWLVQDDTAGEQDSARPLLLDFRAQAGVRHERPHPSVARLVFDFAFWKPGINRFFVRGEVSKGAARRRVESAVAQLTYEVPRSLGLDEPSVFELPEQHFPRTPEHGAATLCKDRDHDGLCDLWENVAAQQLRPRLMLDTDDDLFRRRSDVVRVLSSITPLVRGGEPYVLFANVVVFSRDYGHLIGWDHPGDTEAFGMLFRVERDGGRERLRWVSSAAKGHACITCAPRFSFLEQEFADDGTPVVFVERDKHGLWQNGRACRAKGAYRCGGGRALRPDALNVGDFSPSGTRALVDRLDGLRPDGPFGELAGVFPGDAVWTASSARVPGRFCGGKRACTRSHSANMPGAVLASLVKLFSERRF